MVIKTFDKCFQRQNVFIIAELYSNGNIIRGMGYTERKSIAEVWRSARNNWIPKRDGYIHTYKLFPRCDAELVASR